jgi:menaquinone-9 beta-reductase
MYDVAIIGGGLAGLASAIQLKKAGFSVVLFEKNTYPFMRVCGEYISLESWNFIESLGVDLKNQDLPIFKKLIISSPNGTEIKHQDWLGGFGISRYSLDYQLYNVAKNEGVIVLESTNITNIHFENEKFSIETASEIFISKVCIGTYGKKSNLDIKFKRAFLDSKNLRLNNYIGIKYHIKIDFPKDTIVLHNFKNGYCGMSAIEDDKYCLCYLSKASNLKNSNNQIKEMETKVLSENPFLKNIFETAEFIDKQPVVISQISFEQKELVQNHVIMLGDAAGMITPLCGNGMSMALHSSKIVSEQIQFFLKDTISRKKMEENFIFNWKKHFEKRLKVGRIIQSMFGNKFATELLIRFLKPFPSLLSLILKNTHGDSF